MAVRRSILTLCFLSLADLSLLYAHSAVAGKMVFTGGSSSDFFELSTDYQAERGVLALEPQFNTRSGVQVEVIAQSVSTGRSPASADSPGETRQIFKKAPLSGPTFIRLEPSRDTLLIRVIAP